MHNFRKVDPWLALLGALAVTTLAGLAVATVPVAMEKFEIDHDYLDHPPREVPVAPVHYIMLTDNERTQTLAEDISSTDVASSWLQKKVEEVRKDMGYSDALPIRSDFKFHRFLNGGAGLKVDVSNPKRHFWYCMVSLSPEMQSYATKANIKLTLAHEIRHCYQDRSGSPKSWERDADLAAAKTYGPQAELDNLEALRYHFQDLNDDVTHGSLPEREQAIRNAFPKADDYMTKPLPIICSAVGCWQGQGLSKRLDDQPHPAKAAVSGLTRLASGP